METSAHSNGIVSLAIFPFNLNDAYAKQNKGNNKKIRRFTFFMISNFKTCFD